MKDIILNFTDYKTVHRLTLGIAENLDFPDYYGDNWHAWWDCMTDLDWLPSEYLNVNIKILNWKPSHKDKDNARIFLQQVNEIEEYWKHIPKGHKGLTAPRKLAFVILDTEELVVC